MMTFRIPAATRKALQRAADEEHRSLSNLAVAILTEWLEQRRHLPKRSTDRQRKGRA